MHCTSAVRSELASIPDHPQHGGVQGGSGSRSRGAGVDGHGLALSVELADVEHDQCGFAYSAGLGRATTEAVRG
jgi:hypothetical protein